MDPNLAIAFRGRTRRSAWERLSHGLYVPRFAHEPVDELAAWQLVLPLQSAFSHLTAAERFGWWVPAQVEHPVFVAMSDRTGGPRRRGLHVTRHPMPVDGVVREGLRLTSAAETLLALARDLELLDLVAVADAALRAEDCTLEQLRATSAQRRRGAPMLRRALPYVDARSESAWESVMRVLHVAADIPVTPQHEIHDEAGRFVARVDLWVDGTRRIHEYDGADHRLPSVHRKDLVRDRALLRARVERYGYTAPQLMHGGREIIAEVDRVLDRPSDPRRLRRWGALVAGSMWSPTGRARLLRRWARADDGTGARRQEN